MRLPSDMNTPDMLDGKGNPVLERSHMTTEHANLSRQKERTAQIPTQVPGPLPSDDEDELEEMAFDQARDLRRFRKGGRPGTAPGVG
jgi:hypothetical protein